VSSDPTVLTVAALTVREASRRRVLLALTALTVVLLALSGWGFSRLEAAAGGTLTSGEARLTASIVLNLVMFGFSLIAALGTAFLAGPTLAGETESGIALAMLARPVRRSASCWARRSAWSSSAAASWSPPGWPSASSSGRRSATGLLTW
jgi:ABC-type transport system involved in multi-copper enzyme maturation permease subunit